MIKFNEKEALLCLILKNLEAEGEARRLQAELIAASGLDEVDKKEVMEISGDETNHAIKYEAMYRKYSGVTPADDGLREALHVVAHGKEANPLLQWRPTKE